MKSACLILLIVCHASQWYQAGALPGSPIAPRHMAPRFGMFPSSGSRATLILRPNLKVLDPRTAMDNMGKTALMETQIGEQIKALLGEGLDQDEYHLQKLKQMRDDEINSYLSLSECRNSVHCHRLFTKYLALLTNIVDGKDSTSFSN